MSLSFLLFNTLFIIIMVVTYFNCSTKHNISKSNLTYPVNDSIEFINIEDSSVDMHEQRHVKSIESKLDQI